MRLKSILTVCIALSIIPPLTLVYGYSLEEGRVHERLAMEAFEAEDLASAAMHFEEALAARPNHPGYLFNLVYLNAAQNHLDASIEYLKSYAQLGLVTNLERALFDPIREHSDFDDVRQMIALNAEAQGEAALLLSTDQPLAIAEAIAYDASRDRYLMSSVHERRIVSVTPDGVVHPFVETAANGLFGVFGMRVDADRDLLWVASSAIEQMQGYSDAQEGTAGIFAFSLSDGNLVQKNILSPNEQGGQIIGDLLLLANHEILATNSLNNVVFHFAPDGMLMGEYVINDAGSLQGLVINDDETHVVVADYSSGLHILDLENGESKMIEAPDDKTLIGLDGLSRHGNLLIGVQNGINPNRVLGIELSSDWQRIERVDYLLVNHPDFEEPTTGLVMNNRFLMIANSQWPRFSSMDNVSEETLDNLSNINVLSIDLYK